LASASQHRAALLNNAGLNIDTEPAQIDERLIEKPLLQAGLLPDDIAQVLAEAKAQDVSERHPDKLVIGCDQTLSLDGDMYHKPKDMKQARQHLLSFSAKTHQLNSAISIVLNSQTLWRHVSVANMTMRTLEPPFIGQYLARVGNRALGSVGAYQIEGIGIQLFDKVDGDYFTIVGLPLLPLLKELRSLGAIDG